MLEKISEGKAIFYAGTGKISKKLEVFYNPVMKFNRDISIYLLKTLKKKDIQASLPLAGSGIRALRFSLEIPELFKTINVNDYSKNAIKIIKKNIKLNKIKNITIHNKDANLFLLEGKGFDYIDIDPFGSPNPFLDSACKRLSRKGILAVTATDTSALAGAFPKACERKYWSKPNKTHLKHEIGLRILIRKVQLVASQYDKALIPIYSYSKEHYMRIFFLCDKGKIKVDNLLKNHKQYQDSFIWAGQLWDSKLAKKIAKLDGSRFTQEIAKESQIPIVGFYNIPEFHKKNKLKEMPKLDLIIEKIKESKNKSYKAARTHFQPNSIRTNINEKELIKIIKKLS